MAGLSAVTSTYPLDLARARMAVTERARYTNLREVFHLIIRDEGVRALYRGFKPTALGVVPYSGVSFSTYEMLKRLKRRCTHFSRSAHIYSTVYSLHYSILYI